MTEKKTIIIVCVSNTCRSPMAEYLCRQYLQNQGLHEAPFVVISRSLSTDYEPEGSPASAQGVEVISSDYGMDMSPHRSTLLTQEDVNNAFTIIPVKRDLGNAIKSYFSGAIDKLMYFKQDIPDPWHQPVSVFRQCAKNIHSMLPEVVERVKQQLFDEYERTGMKK